MAENKEPFMTPEQAAQWKQKWAAMRQQQLKEMQAMTMEERFNGFGSLMESVRDFPVDERRQQEVEDVRRRWQRIHRKYR